MTKAAYTKACVTSLHSKGYEKLGPRAKKTARAEEVRRICNPLSGLAYFFTWYAMVQIKGRGEGSGWQRFCPGGRPRINLKTGKSWAWQIAMLGQYLLYEILFILKARQLGMTFVDANVALWAAISAHDQSIAVISNKLQTSKRFVRYVREVYTRLPQWLKDEFELTNPGITRLEFSNGSAIEPFSGAPGASRSMSATWVFVDEVGEIENLDEVFSDLEACADEGGRVVMFGTSDGEMGSTLEAWATDGDGGREVAMVRQPLPDGTTQELPVKIGEMEIAFLFLPWDLAAGRDEKWLATKRRRYRGSLEKFAANYPSAPADAFHAIGRGYFNVDGLKRHIAAIRPVWEARDRRGTLMWLDYSQRTVKFVLDDIGPVTIHASHEEFEARLALRRPFLIGADCAGDEPTGDYHAASGLQTGILPDKPVMPGDFVLERAVQLLTIHGFMDGDTYAELLMMAGFLLGTAVLAIEDNGVGQSVIKTCRKARYPALYTRRKPPVSKFDKPTTSLGWHTTGGSKHIAFGGVENKLRNDYMEIRDLQTLIEMVGVRHLGGGKLAAPAPKHDDRVVGLAIADAVSPQARAFDAPGLRPAPEGPPPNSIDAILAEIDEKERRRALLGAEQAEMHVYR